MADIQGIDTHDFTVGYPEEPERNISGRLYLPEGAEERGDELPYVMLMHGFKGFMDWGFFPEIARRLTASGIAAVSFNFSGSGIGSDMLEISDDEAFAKNTPSRSLEDSDQVRAMIEHGALPAIHPNRRGILGHSFGGGVALLHAAKHHDYQAVVAWAPVGDFKRRIVERELWRKQGFLEFPNGRTGQIHRLNVSWLDDVIDNADALDIEAACARLSTPTLICHGSDDQAVPIDEGEMLREAFDQGVCRLLRVEGAGHTFGGTHPLTRIAPELETVLEETVGTFAARLL